MTTEKFYIYDLETGFPTEVTQEQYLAHEDTKKRVWEAMKPKLDIKARVLLTGTGGAPPFESYSGSGVSWQKFDEVGLQHPGPITEAKLLASCNLNTWPAMELPPFTAIKKRKGGLTWMIDADVAKTLGEKFIEIIAKRRKP